MSTLIPTFATYRTADILDFLVEAVDAARVAAAGNQRWLNAIDNGYDDLLQVDVIAFDAALHTIRIESASTPGKFYIANGDCQCDAFAQREPCRHRAAARLVRRALELRDAAVARKAAELRGRISRAVAAVLVREPLGYIPATTAAERQANYERSLREVSELFPS